MRCNAGMLAYAAVVCRMTARWNRKPRGNKHLANEALIVPGCDGVIWVVEGALAVKRLFEPPPAIARPRHFAFGFLVPAPAGCGRRPDKHGRREPDIQTKPVPCRGSALFGRRVVLAGGRGERSIFIGARTRPCRSFCGGGDRVL